MKKIFFYDYKICNLKKTLCLGIAEEDGAICRVCFSPLKKPECFEEGETPLIKKTSVQLDEYFMGKRKKFDIPLKLNGTGFQIKVWTALQKIEYGERRNYGFLADMIGNPKASRAVGMANNRNPIVIIVPCHRIIGHDGSLTGYAGGLELKQSLLDLEAGI
ncbi:MAG: methylated-DNA--[protein]-cysteine S-methyltransferase [Treponema sp.]|nr:methylated-DNA--[protein]-cysteine S-methyltransferase [Treponema sp.]MCL2272061.1 methylated-DNA--[protein]-cysteine S-methyltransferase [Treponema sp.]